MDWTSLKQRLVDARLCMPYKIRHNLIAAEEEKYPQRGTEKDTSIAKSEQTITKTYLHNFDPLKRAPLLYSKTGVYRGYTLFFLFLLKNIECIESPRRGDSNEYGGSVEYPQSMFLSRNMKNIRVFYLKIFSFWRWNFPCIWIGVFS